MKGGNSIRICKTRVITAERISCYAHNGDIVFNASERVNYSAKGELLYDSYSRQCDEESKELLVQEMIGPEEVALGKRYRFKAVRFSRSIQHPKELEELKWAYQLDDEGIIEFPKQGRVMGNIVVKEVTIDQSLWDNKKVTIYAYFENKEGEGRFDAKVKLNQIYVTTSKGKYLFSLEPNYKYKPQVITAKELYNKAVQ